jgi:hypothetical protein
VRRALALLCTLAAALAAAGCGAGAGAAPDERVSLTVTRDFGAQEVVRVPQPRVAGADTVLRLLQRNAQVETAYGGGFVQAIGGLEGGQRDGRPVDWFYYVNGVLADEGAASVRVRPGDRIWWDHHDWGAARDIPAVVGSFPEPFVHGVEGERLPVRIECTDPESAACDVVQQRFTDLGLVSGRGGIGAGDNDQSLRVLVGPWADLRGQELAVDQVDEGPRASGVFVRFDERGRRLTVLDPRGRPARRLGAGSGLVAATKLPERQPVWFVTGTDPAGVQSAARAFDESALTGNFALAVAEDRAVQVPAVAP